jgi:hypothetical protein
VTIQERKVAPNTSPAPESTSVKSEGIETAVRSVMHPGQNSVKISRFLGLAIMYFDDLSCAFCKYKMIVSDHLEIGYEALLVEQSGLVSIREILQKHEAGNERLSICGNHKAHHIAVVAGDRCVARRG